MKGKAKNKRKIGKIILIGMSFFLTIILTFTTTLAWFYDSDWANKYVHMAGTVGIEIRKEGALTTSGDNQLHFTITTEKAYPGQAVDVSASVFNNGGRSVVEGKVGSPCYIRAHFAVYTNIGVDEPQSADYITIDYPDGTTNPQYIKDMEEFAFETNLNGQTLYAFLDSIISKQNASQSNYKWIYYTQTGSLPLSESGTETTDVKYWLDGVKSDTNQSTLTDRGYFYLCYPDADVANQDVLKPLSVNEEAVFLWNDTFIIPWKLSNYSADKIIFVGVTFQAIQTFIPIVGSNGVIDANPDNQLAANLCTYDDNSVQTVFNSCNFGEINTTLIINGTEINFDTDSSYSKVYKPAP